jgi:ketosteroid isomerase-like protein
MSIDRIAYVKHLFDEYKNKNINAVFEAFAPDIKIYQTKGLPWGGFYEGMDGAVQFFTGMNGELDSESDPKGLFMAGDKVISIGRTVGRMVRSGNPIDARVVIVFSFNDDDKIKKMEFYADTPKILSAL